MSSHHSGLCAVCSTLNLTFKYPPKEVPFEEWLADWEKQRPQYNWRTQDRSWEARWKRIEKKSKARIRRLLKDGRWSDSDSEDDTDYSMSEWSTDCDEDDASDARDGGNVRSEGGGDEVDDTDDGGDDDESEGTNDNKSEGIDEGGHAEEIVDGSDSDSDSQSYEDARSYLGGSTDKDGMAERRAARELEVSGSGSGSEVSEDDGNDDNEDEGEDEDMKKFRAEMDERRRQTFRRVLDYLSMDPSQYREENRPNYKYAQPYVLKRKTTAEGAESEYESDGQSTINHFLQFGPGYAVESDKKFERGIRDETDTHRAELSLKERWKLETHHVRRRHKEARKPVELGTVLDICGRLPCPLCMLLLEMLKPSLHCPAEYDRNEFKVEWIPGDLGKEKVWLEFDSEDENNDNIEFMIWPMVGGTHLGSIRRAESADLITHDSGYGRLPWLAPSLEISAYQPINTGRFRERLEQCQRNHSICRAIQNSTSVDTNYWTLFVDVDRGCLVHGTLGQKYLALSYVWGNAPTLQTTQKSLAELMQPASLDSKHEALSRVVRDAITLTQMLGERFLWVDALCIVQDDAANKSRHISNMDLIYKQAALTIIAHSATSSDSPLQGVTDGTRFPIVRSRRIGGLEVISQSMSLQSPSISSRYDTRGWTYQEEVLSPRRLYIYHSHACFECCTARYFDVIDREEEVRREWYGSTGEVVATLQHRHATRESHSPLPFDAENYQLYLETVRAFSARNLTLQSDRLNAFSGMVKVLDKIFETPFCDGLPERFLDAALLWSSHPKGRYHLYEWEYEGHLKIYARNPDFPSWSWSGHGYRLEGYNGFALIFTQSDCRKILSEVAGFAVLSPGDDQPRRISRSTSCPLVDLAQGDQDVTQNLSPDVLDRVARAQTTNILCFPARVVDGDCLLIDGMPSRLCSGRIFTAGTEWYCGMLYPDDSEVWRDPPRGRRRWIILSRGCVEGPDGPGFEKKEGIGYSEHFNEDKFKIWCKWTYYHVMLVEEKGGDVVERLALGQIHIDAWPVDKERLETVFLG
ncbi:hypothetical protein NW759_017105 [Fusarium solani]|nr:hypothetical protein NW759_017105 [Fusarium solani]